LREIAAELLGMDEPRRRLAAAMSGLVAADAVREKLKRDARAPRPKQHRCRKA
jgi:hypothetical protein